MKTGFGRRLFVGSVVAGIPLLTSGASIVLIGVPFVPLCVGYSVAAALVLGLMDLHVQAHACPVEALSTPNPPAGPRPQRP